MGVVAKVRAGLVREIRTEAQLHEWACVTAGIHVPRQNVCEGHDAPFEYLKRSFFEPAKDLVVWAPRGGGKTRLGAVATLLDLIHKPGCQVRILGGSLEQSLKMWEHLGADVETLVRGRMLRGKCRGNRIQLSNRSAAGVLTQSQRAVRGLRVQKLRCDEVELFDPAVWEAAQLVTRSKEGSGFGGQGSERRGRIAIAGVVEALSTLHSPYGLMSRVVESAEKNGTRVIRWCLLEVLEKCPPERECASCPLWAECRGVAKTKCEGFVRIDDAIAMRARVSRETWESEMLCRRPSVKGCVFPSFDTGVHVKELAEAVGEGDRPWLGVDFGFAAPFVCLFIRETAGGVTHVVDEYVQEQQTIDEHVRQIERRWGRDVTIACDPAGSARNEQTATSNVATLRRAGFRVKFRKSFIQDGVELVRTALKAGDGKVSLFIHPRCQRLIRAMRSYRYGQGASEVPLKDGEHDHLIDALRYYFVNREKGEVATRVY